MIRIISTILLLIASNAVMTFAWYGHLFEKRFSSAGFAGLTAAIVISWAIAFFEYMFHVPASRIGSDTHGGPFDLFQLKILQEIITLSVFTVIAICIFKTGKLSLNHLAAFACLVLAVYFAFRK